MFRHPRFKSQFRVEIAEPNLLFLLSETETQVIEGRLPVLLAPHLDGRHTFKALIDALDGRAGPLDIQFGLELLSERGCLTEAGAEPPDPTERFAEELGVSALRARQQLTRVPVTVTVIGDVRREPFVALLQALGLAVCERARFHVVLTDDYLREELAERNRRAIARGQTWMLVRPAGSLLWIGPIFHPPETPCWACLAKRLGEHRQVEAWLASRNGLGTRENDSVAALGKHGSRGAAPAATLPSAEQAALAIAATEVLKQIVQGRNESLWGKLVTLDTRTLYMATHRVVKQARCVACGDRAASPRALGQRIVLRAREKLHISDGGFRSASPEEMLAEFEHHVSPITGIVSRIEARHPPEERAVSVYVARHTFPRHELPGEFPALGFERRSAGKGMTRQQARASALGEALERYSGAFQGDEPRRTATLAELGEDAIPPGDLLLFSQRQFRLRERTNARGSLFNWIPMPFEPGSAIEWTPVWSLTGRKFRYVPTAYCYYGYPLADGHDFCRADSNGCAAGRSVEEAILQGFLELVERDAVSLWWYNRLERPGVDLRSFNQPYFARLLERYQELARPLHVLDITSDFGIPAFAAVSTLREKPRQGLLLGFGAHFDAAIAIGRALTEVNQFLPSVRLGNQRVLYDNRLTDHAFLLPSRRMGIHRARDFQLAESGDLRDDVLRCVARARRLGLETLVLDQTREDVGLRVVKVIVPGMRTFWARFAPGRLYQVPLRMGWRRRPVREEELNPAHLSI